ncbi:hypothetical protein SAMN05519104_7895 [Rhizobiales bacterium GAS188]|nr:hypothetical protein SAMN05519104_7895 [Rhizobiales bacterium GAS188]
MRVQPDPDPNVADLAPTDATITVYDESKAIVYLRLLDARVVLHRDPDEDEARARRCYESHLARAQWMSEQGNQQLREALIGTKCRRGGTCSNSPTHGVGTALPLAPGRASTRRRRLNHRCNAPAAGYISLGVTRLRLPWRGSDSRV